MQPTLAAAARDLTANFTPPQSSELGLKPDRKFSNKAAFLILSLALFACYLPVLLGTYGCADDFLWVQSTLQHNFRHMQLLQIVQGRPMMAVLFTAGFGGITNVSDLRFLRLFSVLTLVGLSYTTYRTMTGAKFSKTASICVATTMCVMPAFQVYVSWASTAFYATAALVAGLALLLAERAYTETKIAAKTRLAIFATLVLLTSILIFQPAGMFYWVYAAILMFKPNTSLQDACKRFVWYGALCVVALAVAFGICQWGRTAFAVECPLPHQRSHLTHHLKEKLGWFFTQPMTTCLNFAVLFANTKTAIWSAAAIVAGLAVFLRDRIPARFAKLALALSLIPLSYLPNLVVEENWASFRTECALSSIVVLYAFFALMGVRTTLLKSVRESIFNALLISLTLASMAVAFNNVFHYFVVPNSLEFAILKGQMNSKTDNKLTFQQIALKDWRLLTPGVAQEFGCPSSPIKFAQEPMEYILRRTNP